MRRRTLLLLTCLSAGATALAMTVAPAVADVTPPSVSETLNPGESITIAKTVDVPAVPPKLDFVLDVDLSGSYNDDLPNITMLAPDLFDDIRDGVADSTFGLTTFVDFPFQPWGFPPAGDYAYQLDQNLTADKTTWVNAVNAMGTRDGFDAPESQYESLYQAATGAGRDADGNGSFADTGDIAPGQGVAFRADATKVIAITTDAPFHTAGDSSCTSPSPPCPFSYPGPSAADAIAALNAAGIKIIALKAPGSGAEMDALAAATGGSVQTTSSSSSDIAAAILAALEELTFTVTANAVGCDPLTVSFVPASHSGVAGGTSVAFDETISVPSGTVPGTYSCTVQFLADDTVIGIQGITVEVNAPPDCAGATPTDALLWPPNHKLRSGFLAVSDPDGDAVAITITGITSDEPVDAPGTGDGATSPDAVIGADGAYQVRAERAGTGDGRVYLIAFDAVDADGGACSGEVAVGVPHDLGAGATPVDSRPPSFDATLP